jgi:hypothetical protein
VEANKMWGTNIKVMNKENFIKTSGFGVSIMTRKDVN